MVATKDKCLAFNVNTKDLKINCYVDADFAGLHSHEDNNEPISSKSRTGYVITLGDSPISWSSRLQTETALSTTEAKILALSASMREIIWVRRLIKDISDGFGIPIDSVTEIKATVYEGNQTAISNASKYTINNRTRHIHTKYWHFREYVGEEYGIIIQYIKSEENIRDIFTKGTKAELYVPLCNKLMGWQSEN